MCSNCGKAGKNPRLFPRRIWFLSRCRRREKSLHDDGLFPPLLSPHPWQRPFGSKSSSGGSRKRDRISAPQPAPPSFSLYLRRDSTATETATAFRSRPSMVECRGAAYLEGARKTEKGPRFDCLRQGSDRIPWRKCSPKCVCKYIYIFKASRRYDYINIPELSKMCLKKRNI